VSHIVLSHCSISNSSSTTDGCITRETFVSTLKKVASWRHVTSRDTSLNHSYQTDKNADPIWWILTCSWSYRSDGTFALLPMVRSQGN